MAQSRTFAHQAYRVLAVAMREVERGVEKLNIETVEQNLTYLGLVAMMDPPHREVPEAITRCRKAGVRAIMITGDHPLTALAIARQIGLAPKESRTESAVYTPVIEGYQVESMSDEALRRLLTPTRPDEAEPVFARMAPRHKMRVVSVLKDMGEVVAVTGDGVNDAPAIKKADIGIAMGIAGTDVAKETADMILLDDNFATIVNAIEEGRAVYANIRKFSTYVLASNVPEVVPYLGYGLFGIPLALTVPQILAVDLGTDMVPALALGAEKPDAGIMAIPPRPRTERLMNLPLLLRAYVFLGLIEAGIAMAAFFLLLLTQGWTWGMPLDWADPLYTQATAVTFAAIVLAQVANVFACRSERVSIFRLGFLSNRFVLWGIAVELILLLVLIYTPFGNWILGTSPLPAWVWPPLIVGAIGLLLAEELRKFIVARYFSGDRWRRFTDLTHADTPTTA
jgi:sodium/potassium-transporting ATPase subunit alpha